MCKAALRVTILGLVLVCLACNGQPNDLTAPSLDGLGSLSSEKKGGNGGGNGGGGGPPVSDVFTHEFTGDISFSAAVLYSNSGDGHIVTFHDNWHNAGVTINMAFLAGVGGDFVNCFSNTAATNVGSIVLDVGSSPPSAAFVFSGWEKDGATAVSYRLIAEGTFNGLPAANNSETFDFDQVWTVAARDRKDRRQGRACEGEGSFILSTSDVVTNIVDPPQ